MPRNLEEWTVLPHDPPALVTDDILTVVGEIGMPLMTLPRRMTVVRLKDRRLVIFSAIALDDAEMKRLEDFGAPAFLIVPNDHHRMDAKIWKARYPALAVIAPPGARAAVEEAVPVDATAGEFGDPSVRLVIVPGTSGREAALEVRRPGGLTLVVNDLIGNITDAKGFGGWLLKRMGFAGEEPHLPTPVRRNLVDDKAALRGQFLAWANDPALRRILVSHGRTIEDDPRAALKGLAEALA
ncbi:MAG TPA: hypothetical protein VGW40_03790 [Allosphingosinicella sp.]|nr:hypothetical protein [Allosphingosinicella sp.]